MAPTHKTHFQKQELKNRHDGIKKYQKMIHDHYKKNENILVKIRNYLELIGSSKANNKLGKIKTESLNSDEMKKLKHKNLLHNYYALKHQEHQNNNYINSLKEKIMRIKSI